MKKFIPLILFNIGFDIKLLAQSTEPIQTDRPDQTECPFIVPEKYFQVENGFGIIYNDRLHKDYTYPSTLIKYGVTKNFDLRLITGVINTRLEEERVTGVPPLTIGFKVNIFEEHGIIPMTSFIGQLTFPTLASSKYKATYYAPSFRFTMQHTLSKRVALGYNLGALWNGESPEPIFLYTLTSGISLSEKIGSYVEVYGFAPQHGTPQHNVDAGFSYLLTQDILFDISAGYRITHDAPKYFTAVGFSFRVNTQRRK